MNEKLKRRLAGAAVLLALTFVVVSLLPTPEQAARRPDADVVTIPLHEVVADEPAPSAAAGTPPGLAAPEPAPATAPAEGEGEVADSSGDDDGAPVPDAPPAEPRKPVQLAMEPALKTPREEPPGAPKPADAAPAATGQPAEALPSKPADKPVEPPAAKTPVTAPAPKPMPAPAGRWFVQVGGFADIANARQVQSRLQAMGEPNLLAPIDAAKGTIYRVRAGPYASRDAAQLALGKIAAAYPGSQLVEP